MPKASTLTVALNVKDIKEYSVLLATEQLRKCDSESEDTRNILIDDILGKSGDVLRLCVALAKGIDLQELSDDTLLKASQSLDVCVHSFEEFAVVKK